MNSRPLRFRSENVSEEPSKMLQINRLLNHKFDKNLGKLKNAY